MIDGYALTREWLLDQPEVVALVGDRIRAAAVYPEEGTPSITIGPWTATARSSPQRPIDVFWDLNVPLWVFAGEVEGSEEPDTVAALEVMSAIVAAAKRHNLTHNRLPMSGGVELCSIQVTSSAPTGAVETQAARGTVTLTMTFLVD